MAKSFTPTSTRGKRPVSKRCLAQLDSLTHGKFFWWGSSPKSIHEIGIGAVKQHLMRTRRTPTSASSNLIDANSRIALLAFGLLSTSLLAVSTTCLQQASAPKKAANTCKTLRGCARMLGDAGWQYIDGFF